MRTLAMILAGGAGSRLSVLTQKRTKPAVPFAGKYRIIDFTLSNCANSGIFTVGVCTQYRPRSLNDHIRSGRPWDLDRATGGVTLLQPYAGPRESDWYQVVGKNTPIPAHTCIGHDCTIAADLSQDAFEGDRIASSTAIGVVDQ